jgi:protein-S-isoprenylcysteine O-methyltransferase Ste14
VTIQRRAGSDLLGFAWYLGSAIWLLAGIPRSGPALLLPVALELAVAAVFLIRRPAIQVDRDWSARIVAYSATFLIPAVVRFAPPDWTATSSIPMLQAIGGSLWISGAVLMVWPLWYLRRAFGIEAAARELVASGPYRYSRHPIYACYVLNYTGLCLLRLTPLMVGTTACWYAIMIMRARNEERVMEAAFPEYAEYRRRVGWFLSGPRASSVASSTS